MPCPFYAHEAGVKCVNPAHLNLMPASDDGDAEHTIGRAATLRPTLDHNKQTVAWCGVRARAPP
jgi:hypothetical protein